MHDFRDGAPKQYEIRSIFIPLLLALTIKITNSAACSRRNTALANDMSLLCNNLLLQLAAAAPRGVAVSIILTEMFTGDM
jgi:hypothetical protein